MQRCEGCQQGWSNGHWKRTEAGPCTCPLNFPFTPNNCISRHSHAQTAKMLVEWTAGLQIGDEVALYTNVAEKDELGNLNDYDYAIRVVTAIIREGTIFVDRRFVTPPVYVIEDLAFDVHGHLASFTPPPWRHLNCPTQIRRVTPKLRDSVERKKLLQDLQAHDLKYLSLDRLRVIHAVATTKVPPLVTFEEPRPKEAT